MVTNGLTTAKNIQFQIISKSFQSIRKITMMACHLTKPDQTIPNLTIPNLSPTVISRINWLN